jgi:hypothetical protein
MATQRVSRVDVTTVERRIYFYRVDAGVDGAGRPLAFDPEPVLRCVNDLPFTTDGRYWQDAEGGYTCCWVDQLTDVPRLRFGHIRRSGFPLVERGGDITALRIPTASGLVEQVHVVFLPHLIIGSEFNFYGPRVPRLAQYLLAKAEPFCPPIVFAPLLRQDVAEQLHQLRDVRMVRLRIRTSYAARVAEADRDLGAAFKAAQRVGSAEEVEITLKSLPYSRRPLARRLLDAVRRLAAHEDLRDAVSFFHVKGWNEQTGQVELVDVLSDQLIARSQIISLDRLTRALSPASAYEAIERAYEDLRPQLLVAAGVEL